MKTQKLSSIKYWLLSNLLKTKSEQGYVLVFAMALVFGLAGLVLVYAKTTRVEQVSNTATVDTNSGFYAAEGALNERANKITKIYENSGTPTGTSPTSSTACFDGGNKGSGDYQCEEYYFSGGNAQRSGLSATTYVIEKNNGEGTVGNVPPGQNHAGLNMIEYGHSIYALAFKDSDVTQKKQQDNGVGKGAIAILQMDIKNRLIPLFQFAAFYKDDLEIFPGPPMTLNGPIHSNGELYLGGALQKIGGEVSSGGKNIYGAKKVATAINPSEYKTKLLDKFQMPSLKIGIDPLGLPDANFLTTTGKYYQKADIRIEFKPKDTTTGNMNYLKDNIPFEFTSIDQTSGTEKKLTEAQRRSLLQPVMVGADIASIDEFSGTSPSGNDIKNPFHACKPTDKQSIEIKINNLESILSRTALQEAELLRLKEVRDFLNGLTYTQKNQFRDVTQKYIQEQIHSLKAPLLFTLLDIPIVNVGVTGHNNSIKTPVGLYADVLYGTFATDVSLSDLKTKLSAFSDKDAAIEIIKKMSAQEIAGLSEYNSSNNPIEGTARCFVAAPIIEIGRNAAAHSSPFRFYNNREKRDMRLLQVNFQSLAIWNRDGVYMDGSTTTDTKGKNLIYVPALADTSAPEGSFQYLGLAAQDTTEDGIVIYATIDKNSYSYEARKSPYGFAIVKGQQLFALGTTPKNQNPTGVTFATDQAVYVQGDYNLKDKDYHTDAAASMSSPTTSFVTRSHNYQPASILADSFQPLSNACITEDITINRLATVNCDINKDVNGNYNGKVVPTHTEFNAGIVASTDRTNDPDQGSGYNGGLENYPRFLENWTKKEWRYQGSFVSLSIPAQVSGKWGQGNVYSAPLRPWDYDLKFNDAKNLPPLTPRFSAMKQESFIRSFDQ